MDSMKSYGQKAVVKKYLNESFAKRTFNIYISQKVSETERTGISGPLDHMDGGPMSDWESRK